jgi:putative ABC transport system ATP-binding protein
MTQPAAVELRNVTKVFTTREIETHALSNVSLRIERGEFIAVVGPSGGGKSTLLSILGLLDDATTGKYYLGGRDVDGLDVNDRAKIRNREIGFVFQSFNLIGDLSVYENVELPLLYGGMPGSERVARVESALQRVDMLHRRNHLPSQLSGGQQQRVAIARAICGEPTLLLADEPTGNLDSRNGDGIIELLSELNAAGSTICMVTHDPRYARQARRRVFLLDGRILDAPDGMLQVVLEQHGFGTGAMEARVSSPAPTHEGHR